jgi:hypothetical protein
MTKIYAIESIRNGKTVYSKNKNIKSYSVYNLLKKLVEKKNKYYCTDVNPTFSKNNKNYYKLKPCNELEFLSCLKRFQESIEY